MTFCQKTSCVNLSGADGRGANFLILEILNFTPMLTNGQARLITLPLLSDPGQRSLLACGSNAGTWTASVAQTMVSGGIRCQGNAFFAL